MTTRHAPMQLAPGFADPVLDAQHAFRAALEAFSHPGRGVHIPLELTPPPGLVSASAAFLLAMLDLDASLWLQNRSDAVCNFLRFHCGCEIVDDPRRARFALITDAAGMPDLASFDPGEPDYPDRSTTLVVQVPRLMGGRRARVSGPGVSGHAHVEPGALRPDFWPQWQRNHALFPCGVDLLFACGSSLVALPRTTRVEV